MGISSDYIWAHLLDILGISVVYVGHICGISCRLVAQIVVIATPNTSSVSTFGIFLLKGGSPSPPRRDSRDSGFGLLQGGFFNWSALKMTKCQITCKSLQKSSKCQNFQRVWHLVIFRADQLKKPPCRFRQTKKSQLTEDGVCRLSN